MERPGFWGLTQAIPGLTFPGGALVGCSAGFLNLPKIKARAALALRPQGAAASERGREGLGRPAPAHSIWPLLFRPRAPTACSVEQRAFPATSDQQH